MEAKTSQVEQPNLIQNLMRHRGVRNTAAGFAGGAGVAAVLNLMHELHVEKKRREMHRDINRTDENTIVLTLPNKSAEVTACESEPTAVKQVERGGSSTSTVPVKTYRVGHYGTSQMKVAELPSWFNWALGTLATGAGGVGGYKAVDALYQARLKRKLQKEEDAARQEMLDMLQNPGMKTASWLDDIIDISGIAKHSQSRLDPVLGIPTLLWLLGTGGTAYLTKRVLDAQKEEQDQEGLDAPKVRRIVFRSQPGASDPQLKQASAEDLDMLQSYVFVLMDKMGADTRILTHEDVTPLLKKAGLTVPGMFKLADNVSDLMTRLQSDPELWKTIKRVGIEQFPSVRRFGWGNMHATVPAGAANWIADLPGVRGKTDNMMRQRMEQMLRTGGSASQGIDLKQPANKVPGMLSNMFPAGMMNTASKALQRFPAAMTRARQAYTQNPDTRWSSGWDAFMGKGKYASIVAPIMHSFAGSTLARGRKPDGQQAETWDKLPERTDVNRVLRNISLEAEDPEAQDFLQAKRGRIRKLLAQLVAEGKL
jgi:hypothetical protein